MTGSRLRSACKSTFSLERGLRPRQWPDGHSYRRSEP